MKALKITLIVLVCIVGVLAGLLSMRRGWAPKPVAVRMTPARPVLKENDVVTDSAWDLFRRAIDTESLDLDGLDDAWKRLDEDNEPWSEAGFSNVVVMLADAREHLALARRAAAAPAPRMPTIVSFDQSLPRLYAVRQITRLLCASARRKAAQGDLAGACAELESAMRFSAVLTRGGILIHHLIDAAVCAQSCRMMRLLAVRYGLPETEARQAVAFLAALEAESEPYGECMRHEYLALDNSLEKALSGLVSDWLQTPKEYESVITVLGPLLGSTPKAIRADFKAYYSHVIRMADQPFDPAAYEAFEQPMAARGWRSVLLHKDPVGLLLVNVAMPGLSRCHERVVSRSVAIRSTRLALAILLFKSATGRVPADLNELVPACLDAVPVDPFDGKPIRYRRDPDGAWRVYSVGPDGTDDGGVGAPGATGTDQVFGPEEFEKKK
ncbi:MAG: hypothetical protein JXR37_32060 [Kiritimatiellae bacterium]|nr:hypothetical protein [Kiritimatiellia bacterium]